MEAFIKLTPEALIAAIEQHRDRLRVDDDYHDSDESISIGHMLLSHASDLYGYDWEDDDEASAYFSRATEDEGWTYWLSVILPKLATS